jgi:hypothetical protein
LIEKITIEQSFQYMDPTTAETNPGWVTVLQPWGDVQIGQGKIFWAAQKNNAELRGVIKLNQFFSILTNNRIFRVTCSQGVYDIGWIIEFKDRVPWYQELHLRKVNP